MKKFLNISTLILRTICGLILVWFTIYFLYGNNFSIRFSKPEYAKSFTQILVFATAVAVYGLFILFIGSKRKRWVNIFLFFSGLIVGSIPLLYYHGYLQYRCGFWNIEQMDAKILYLNSKNSDESVQLIQSKCKLDKEEKFDTLYVKKLNSFLEQVNHPIFVKSENGEWISP